MSSAEPPWRQRDHQHAGEGRAGLGGVAVERHLAAVLGLEQVVDIGHRRHLVRVEPDGHVAAVVVDPGAVGVLVRHGNVVERRDLVRREHRLVGQGHGLAEVEDVGRGALALLLVRGVDLVLARGVGLGGVHRDAVLVGERLDDCAVVGPVRWQRDDVQLALLLGRLDQGVHPAEVRGRGGLAGLHTRLRLLAFGLLLRRGAGREAGDQDGSGGCGCDAAER